MPRGFHALSDLTYQMHVAVSGVTWTSLVIACLQVTLGTNYFGPMLLTELLLPKMKESAPARIVSVGSPAEQFSGGVYWDDLK